MAARAYKFTHPWPYELDSACNPHSTRILCHWPMISWLFYDHFPICFGSQYLNGRCQSEEFLLNPGRKIWMEQNESWAPQFLCPGLCWPFLRGREGGCQMFDSKKLLKANQIKNPLFGHFSLLEQIDQCGYSTTFLAMMLTSHTTESFPKGGNSVVYCQPLKRKQLE